ncbi:MAG: type II toxin-antitoxin system RelB/DinJ family antitoxin [Campylobacteraceae bacterium]|jgi:DNA-damage-inducible protein J|nr:type II toxin-antitoxin system RelB/DinJ family antitoxin [Campylobacteraceae bacterium]
MTSNTSNLNIRVDKDIKNQAEVFFGTMGLTMSAAVNIFLRQSLIQGKIPFELKSDLFYSASNMEYIEKALQEYKEGKRVSKTLDELKAMEK